MYRSELNRMELSDLKIRQVVFEIRYDEAFSLWDRAGAINRELVKIWPGIRLSEAPEPNQVSLKNKDVSIRTGLKTSYVALQQPNNITQNSEQIEATLRLWVKELELSEFSRVGTRVIFTKFYESPASANNAAMSMGLVTYPAPPFFNHKNLPMSAEVSLVWEDGSSQTRIAIKTEHQQLEVDGLPDVQNENIKQTADLLVVDIDRATVGKVGIAKFRATDWIDGVRHLIARDMKRIFKGDKQ